MSTWDIRLSPRNSPALRRDSEIIESSVNVSPNTAEAYSRSSVCFSSLPNVADVPTQQR